MARSGSRKTSDFIAGAGVLLAALLAVASVQAQDVAYPSADELRARYGFAAWPGATGTLYGGVAPGLMRFEGWSPTSEAVVQLQEVRVQEFGRVTPDSDHAARIRYHLARGREDLDLHYLNVEVTVAPTRAAARVLFLLQKRSRRL